MDISPRSIHEHGKFDGRVFTASMSSPPSQYDAVVTLLSVAMVRNSALSLENAALSAENARMRSVLNNFNKPNAAALPASIKSQRRLSVGSRKRAEAKRQIYERRREDAEACKISLPNYAENDDNLCQLQGVEPDTCFSYATCALTPPSRRHLYPFSPWWNRSQHVLPDRPHHRLLVPIQKPMASAADWEAVAASRQAYEATAVRMNHSKPYDTPFLGRTANASFQEDAAVIAAPALVWRRWPSRASFDLQSIPMQRFPDGHLWSNIGRDGYDGACHYQHSKHWYCAHLRPEYYAETRAAYECFLHPLGLFSRGDVRLVLDVGGGTGAFAEAVHSVVGDRIVVLTGLLWAAENDLKCARRHAVLSCTGMELCDRVASENALVLICSCSPLPTLTLACWCADGTQFPQVGLLAARGFAGVIMDMYSFFPFGESSLDVVHTSWTFHDGYPITTLYEIHRVLRPGGYFALRQMPGTGAHLHTVREFALANGWTIVSDRRGCEYIRPGTGDRKAERKVLKDTVIVFRMPMPTAWRNRTFG